MTIFTSAESSTTRSRSFDAAGAVEFTVRVVDAYELNISRDKLSPEYGFVIFGAERCSNGNSI